MGRAGTHIRRQSHEAGRRRFPRAGSEDQYSRQNDNLSSRPGQQGAGRLRAGRFERRSARAVNDAEVVVR